MEVVIASANRGKIGEVIEILSGLPLTFITKDDVPSWPAVEETGRTYVENARLKARALVEATGKAAIADDSGIEVDYLDGRPGVRSARLAGPGATDKQNNVRLISLLFGVPVERRSARYACTALLLTPSGEEYSATGYCEGSIALEPKGAGGFGYDPWFVPAGESRTMAELSAAEKHAISHRGKAFRALREEIKGMLENSAGERT
ncbi:MAG: RdgB/HAM1 family non-canonical purine NTP pyrophosphatase [Actinomycetota bacterium]